MAYQLSAHFSSDEMECHCGAADCPKLPTVSQMQPLLNALELLRFVTGPITVNDAYRCPAHNAEVGGVPNSQHTLGIAADILIPGWPVQKMYDATEHVGAFVAGGVGAYSGKDGSTPRLHVDTRNVRARWGVDQGETQIPIENVVNTDPDRTLLA